MCSTREETAIHPNPEARTGKIGHMATRLLLAAASAATLVAAGCAHHPIQEVGTRAVVAPEPGPDEATLQRNWTQSVAFYHSGTTEAYPTRWPYEPNPDYEDVTNYVLDPIMFLAQTAALPVTVAMDPPFQRVHYRDVVVPPTYTAVPPLPPEAPFIKPPPAFMQVRPAEQPALRPERPQPWERPSSKGKSAPSLPDEGGTSVHPPEGPGVRPDERQPWERSSTADKPAPGISDDGGTRRPPGEK